MERRCARCFKVKPLSDFSGPSGRSQKIDCYCRPCRASYHREHYERNKARYIRQAGERNRREIEWRMQFLLDFLAEHPCVDCGETDPVVLEFDHLEKKSFMVSQGLRYMAWEKVLREISKCEVVCANCHKRRTAARGRFLRLRFARSFAEDAVLRAGEGYRTPVARLEVWGSAIELLPQGRYFSAS